MPVVSVVLIFLNEERFIEEAVLSVCEQTLADWELILVDDGSTDRSSQIARDLAASDDRIRYIEHPDHENRGTGASRNAGARHATAPYIAFIDGDDVWLPEKLHEQVDLLESMPDVALVCGAVLSWWTWNPSAAQADVLDLVVGIADQRLEPPEAALMVAPLGHGETASVDLLVRRSAFDSVGGFEERFRKAFEDQSFYMKIFLRYPVYVSSRVWFRYRQHEESCCAQYDDTSWLAVQHDFLNWLRHYARPLGDARVSAAIERARRETRYRKLTANLHPRLRAPVEHALRMLNARLPTSAPHARP